MPYNRLGNIQTLELEPGVDSDNSCVILTLDNIVEVMGTLTVEDQGSSITKLATLPDGYRPLIDIYIPVAVDNGEVIGAEVKLLRVTADGSMYLSESLTDGTVYLNGIVFNVCDAYYTAAIGNNFSQGTSPLNW